MAWKQDADELESADEQAKLRKKKKKKKFPFYSKAAGGAARRRPDRKAAGGCVRPGDVEPLSSSEANAPAGGKVEQKFQAGGATDTAPVARRARGFNAPRPPWTNYEQEFTRHPSKEWGYAGTGKRATDTDTEDEPEKRASGGHITTARRKALPSSDFALPGKGKGAGGKGPGSYPVDTPGRARSALSRGAANASPAELATIKRKVKAKYPSINVKAGGGAVE
jgi:hypothetical protein